MCYSYFAWRPAGPNLLIIKPYQHIESSIFIAPAEGCGSNSRVWSTYYFLYCHDPVRCSFHRIGCVKQIQGGHPQPGTQCAFFTWHTLGFRPLCPCPRKIQLEAISLLCTFRIIQGLLMGRPSQRWNGHA